MKNYIRPEMKVTKFDVTDVIQADLSSAFDMITIKGDALESTTYEKVVGGNVEIPSTGAINITD